MNAGKSSIVALRFPAYNATGKIRISVSHPDPFTGLWIFSAERSKLSAPAPRSWTQQINATSDELQVREEIVRSDGSQTVLTVQARFDGEEYPVSGSPAVDAIAYRRVDANRIAGTGRKNGRVSLRETVIADPNDGTLTLTYSLYGGDREVANGEAVFQKNPGSGGTV
jgi:hypothetical protein